MLNFALDQSHLCCSQLNSPDIVKMLTVSLIMQEKTGIQRIKSFKNMHGKAGNDKQLARKGAGLC